MTTKTIKSKKRRAPKPRIRVKAKARVAANGTGISPVPKDGPNLTLRAPDRAYIDRLKSAAKKAGMSMNTYATQVLAEAVKLTG